MKCVYMSENAGRIDYVYGGRQKAEIAELFGGEPQTVSGIGPGLEDVEYIFSTWGMPAADEETIERYLPKLKCVFYGAGSVQYFARPFLRRGVRVFSAWQANGIPVAQFAFSQIILSCKGYFGVQHKAKQSRAESKALFGNYPGVYGAKAGILGCGVIGSMVCEMLKSTDLEVLAYDPYMSDEKAERLGVRRASLEEIFSECLVISNHIPNLPSTQKVIMREHLMSMRPYSTFINTGRGAQLEEQDLYDALTADTTRTALLDVMTDEGESDSKPIVKLSNCFITPHIAGSAGLEVHRMADYMIKAYKQYAAGETCAYEVTPEMLETMA